MTNIRIEGGESSVRKYQYWLTVISCCCSFALLFVLWLCCFSFYPSAALTNIQIQEREPSRRKYWDWLTVRSIPLLLWRKYRLRTTQTWVGSCLNCSFVLRFVLSLCSFDKDTDGGMRTTQMQVMHLISSFVRFAVRLLLCCFEEDTTDRATRSTRTRVLHLICSFVYCTFCCNLIIGTHVYSSAALTRISIRGIRTTRDASTAFYDLFVFSFRCTDTFYPSAACFGPKKNFTSIYIDHVAQILFSPSLPPSLPPSLRITMGSVFSLTQEVFMFCVRTLYGVGLWSSEKGLSIGANHSQTWRHADMETCTKDRVSLSK